MNFLIIILFLIKILKKIYIIHMIIFLIRNIKFLLMRKQWIELKTFSDNDK